MRNKKIALIYFYHARFDYTPLDLGYIAAYLIKNKHPANKIELLGIEADELHFFKKKNNYQSKVRKRVDDILKNNPDYAFFFLDNIIKTTLYYELLSLEFSAIIKPLSPHTKIGIHSYHINQEKSVKILKKHDQVDFIFRGEPEKIFLNFFRFKKKTRVKGITFRENNEIIASPDEKMLNDLKELPSPYLTGFFNDFIKNKRFKYVFLSTNRGCPFACHYCYRGTKFPKIRYFPIARVLDELAYLWDVGVVDIVVLDDNFIVSPDKFFSFVRAYKKRFPYGNTPDLGIMTRPEIFTEKIVKAMAEINVDRVQIGLQSINPKVQYLMNRPADFNFKIFSKVKGWLKKYNIKLRQIDLIFGLPGDNFAHFKKALDFAVSLGPKMMQIKQLHFIENSLLAKQKNRYGIKAGKLRFFNVPYVNSSNGFTEADMLRSADYASRIAKKYPEIKFRLLSKHNKNADLSRS